MPEFSGLCSLNDTLIDTVVVAFVGERGHGQSANAAMGRPAGGRQGSMGSAQKEFEVVAAQFTEQDAVKIERLERRSARVRK